MGYDFNLEMKLRREAPALHEIFTANVLCMQNILRKYQAYFPDFTDHTSLHSLEVIAFCNELVGDYIDGLNADEIFLLLMAAYLHDTGMGITADLYEKFSEKLLMVMQYRAAHPDASIDVVIRKFHNEFSGCYIRHFSNLFDFPSPEYLEAVVQISRGHRVTDLFDESEYPKEYQLPNGHIVHLPYLAALIRLADELDIAADRNIQFLYDISNVANNESYIEHLKHQAIRAMNFTPTAFHCLVDYSNPDLVEPLDELFRKLRETLRSCIDVVEKQTPFRICQTSIEIEKIK